MPQGFERWAVISDLHSIFLDERAFSVFLQVYKDNDFDRLCVNGDLLDFPTISEHAQKIEAFNPQIISGYKLQDEIDFTIERILQRLYRARPKTPILVRLGNHEERFIRPNQANARALGEILDANRRRGTTRLEELLRLKDFNAKLSYNGVDRIHGSFTFIHGVSTVPSAPVQNLRKYGSGTSGHSHRGNSFIETYFGGVRGWWESFCLRTTENVEYLPRGAVANWQHGFLTLDIRPTGLFFCQSHIIVKTTKAYSCLYNGQLYQA